MWSYKEADNWIYEGPIEFHVLVRLASIFNIWFWQELAFHDTIYFAYIRIMQSNGIKFEFFRAYMLFLSLNFNPVTLTRSFINLTIPFYCDEDYVTIIFSRVPIFCDIRARTDRRANDLPEISLIHAREKTDAVNNRQAAIRVIVVGRRFVIFFIFF